MWTHLAAGMTLDTDITLGVTSLAGLQITTRLGRVINLPVCGDILLRSAAQRIMGLDLKRPFRETAVAGCTVLLIVAAVTLLLIVLCLYRMNADKIAAMALGFEIPPEV